MYRDIQNSPGDCPARVPPVCVGYTTPAHSAATQIESRTSARGRCPPECRTLPRWAPLMLSNAMHWHDSRQLLLRELTCVLFQHSRYVHTLKQERARRTHPKKCRALLSRQSPPLVCGCSKRCARNACSPAVSHDVDHAVTVCFKLPMGPRDGQRKDVYCVRRRGLRERVVAATSLGCSCESVVSDVEHAHRTET